MDTYEHFVDLVSCRKVEKTTFLVPQRAPQEVPKLAVSFPLPCYRMPLGPVHQTRRPDPSALDAAKALALRISLELPPSGYTKAVPAAHLILLESHWVQTAHG